MADISVVADKLQGFETADDLAEFFRGYGIIAQPMNSRACAITQFVVEETGETNVCTTTTTCFIEDEYGEQTFAFLHTPAMSDFVKKFDTGVYPDLVEEGYTFTKACDCCD